VNFFDFIFEQGLMDIPLVRGDFYIVKQSGSPILVKN